MTGAWIVLAALALALAFGGYRRVTDGRARAVGPGRGPRLDLVEEFGILRTPTVLVLDREGVVRHRIVGAARKDEVLDALEQVGARAA